MEFRDYLPCEGLQRCLQTEGFLLAKLSHLRRYSICLLLDTTELIFLFSWSYFNHSLAEHFPYGENFLSLTWRHQTNNLHWWSISFSRDDVCPSIFFMLLDNSVWNLTSSLFFLSSKWDLSIKSLEHADIISGPPEVLFPWMSSRLEHLQKNMLYLPTGCLLGTEDGHQGCNY